MEIHDEELPLRESPVCRLARPTLVKITFMRKILRLEMVFGGFQRPVLSSCLIKQRCRINIRRFPATNVGEQLKDRPFSDVSLVTSQSCLVFYIRVGWKHALWFYLACKSLNQPRNLHRGQRFLSLTVVSRDALVNHQGMCPLLLLSSDDGHLVSQSWSMSLTGRVSMDLSWVADASRFKVLHLVTNVLECSRASVNSGFLRSQIKLR